MKSQPESPPSRRPSRNGRHRSREFNLPTWPHPTNCLGEIRVRTTELLKVKSVLLGLGSTDRLTLAGRVRVGHAGLPQTHEGCCERGKVTADELVCPMFSFL